MVLVVILVAIVARTCLVISGHTVLLKLLPLVISSHKAIPFHATEVKHDSVFEGDHDLKGGRTDATVDPSFRSALMTSMSLLTS